jgi:peptidoglycan/xylan/chitin deacetylase (PgdA/CDA1 family)
MRQRLLSALNTPALSPLLTLLEAADLTRGGLLRVLTYHRVDIPDAQPALNPSLLSATPDEFEAQMRHLAAHYDPVSVSDVLDFCVDGVPLPPRAVLVTFDDAYADFAQYAWPVLRRVGIPATLFVPTAYPDDPTRIFWWDRLYDAVQRTQIPMLETPFGQVMFQTTYERRKGFKALRSYVKALEHHRAMAWVDDVCARLNVLPLTPAPVLGWAALRQLANEGVSLGAHTHTHPLMNRITLEEARAEAIESRRVLERETGAALPVFAYPSGGFNAAVVQMMERAGFTLAFTTERGVNPLRGLERLQLRRINVARPAALGGLRLQLSPFMRYVS